MIWCRTAQRPLVLPAILRDTEALGFKMASDPRTGSLLRTLAASKPGARLLELGTGTGVGTACLLDGMDARARLETVDEDEAAVAVARKHLGRDARVAFHVMQPSWPEGHGAKVPPLIAALESHADLCCTRLAWATGISAWERTGNLLATE